MGPREGPSSLRDCLEAARQGSCLGGKKVPASCCRLQLRWGTMTSCSTAPNARRALIKLEARPGQAEPVAELIIPRAPVCWGTTTGDSGAAKLLAGGRASGQGGTAQGGWNTGR